MRRSANIPAVVLIVAAAVSWAQQPASPVPSPLMRQLHQAIAASEHGDQGQALSIAEKLVAEHPDFEPALKLQGMLLDQAGRTSDAASSFQKALKLAPNDPEILFSLGVDLLVSGHSKEAIPLFLHDLKLKPRDSDGFYYLAQAYHLDGNNDKAISAIRQCLSLDSNNPAVWQKNGELLSSSGDNDKAIEWLEKASHANPALDRIDYDLGVANYNGMNFQNAADFSHKAVRANPNDLTARRLLASSELKLSLWADAQVEFERLLIANNDDTSALLGLGRCQLELKNYASSEGTLQHLLQIDPTLVLAHFYLSRALTGLGKTEEAKRESDLHNKLMEQSSFAPADHSPESETQKATWAQARQLLSEKHEDEAIRLFQQSSQDAAATLSAAQVMTGALYVSMGYQEDATRVLKHALNSDPRVRGAHTWLGIQAMQQGDLEKAENEFDAELVNDPNYSTATAELGELRYRQKRFADAAEFLSKSKTAIPSLLYLLCDAYFHLGNIADANLTAETLAIYARNDPNMMAALAQLLNRNHQSVLAQRLHPN